MYFVSEFFVFIIVQVQSNNLTIRIVIHWIKMSIISDVGRIQLLSSEREKKIPLHTRSTIYLQRYILMVIRRSWSEPPKGDL